MATCVIVSQAGILRDALALVIERNSTLKVVDCVNSVEEAVRKTYTELPDILLVDLTLPENGGWEAIRATLSAYPSIYCAIFSPVCRPLEIAIAVQAGATGYLNLSSPTRDLPGLLERMQKGERVLCREALEALESAASCRGEEPIRSSIRTRPSSREIEVLDLTVAGMTSVEIGDALGISRRTVESHRARILRRLQLRNIAQLVSVAVGEKGDK